MSRLIMFYLLNLPLISPHPLLNKASSTVMKKLLIACLILISLFPLKADEWLQNGDFSDGLSHWYGDGQLASDLAKSTSDPLAPTPSTPIANGIVLQLKPDRWSKMTQEFTTDTLKMTLTVNYTLSSDCAFSDKADFYHDIFASLGFRGYGPRSVSPGEWTVILSDLGTKWCYYFRTQPNKDANAASQTFQANYSQAGENMKPALHKTITVGFPPGRGNVTITLISLKN